jgi:nucleoside-diphosphate-sugar epimerase
MTSSGCDQSISDKHVLVLGGAGFLGSVLVRALLKLKYTVTVYDNFTYGSHAIQGLDQNDFLCIVQGDIRDKCKLAQIMPGKDIVVNLAAIVGDAACDLDPQATREINSLACSDMFKLADECGVKRFIFASTCSVYGYADETLTESSFLYPVSLYAQSKLASEVLLLALAQKSDVSLTILRFATLFGWSPRPRFDLVVNTMTSTAISSNKVTVFGGNQWRPHLHIRDAAEAVISVIEAPEKQVRSEIFNVGANHLNMTIADLGRRVATAVPNCRLEVREEAADPRNYRVDFSKIKSRLGFNTRYDIYDGIREIYGSFRKGKIPDFTDPTYSNFAYLKGRLAPPRSKPVKKVRRVRVESPGIEVTK